jgi:hypothetical protein
MNYYKIINGDKINLSILQFNIDLLIINLYINIFKNCKLVDDVLHLNIDTSELYNKLLDILNLIDKIKNLNRMKRFNGLYNLKYWDVNDLNILTLKDIKSDDYDILDTYMNKFKYTDSDLFNLTKMNPMLSIIFLYGRVLYFIRRPLSYVKNEEIKEIKEIKIYKCIPEPENDFIIDREIPFKRWTGGDHLGEMEMNSFQGYGNDNLRPYYCKYSKLYFYKSLF